MSINVSGVTKKFGDFVALDNVSVDLPTGQLTALLGPSGGGKSTLLRIIAGLESADDGTVTIEGHEATHLPPQKRNVGFVFQHYAAFKHMSVAKNVAFGLEIRKRPKDEVKRRVDELLELVHLSQFAHRLPSQLSGGQRQRMALARALAVEPSVLLLDEPFGALDAKVRVQLRDEIRRVQLDVGTTTLFVTHDQEEALAVADRVGVMNAGRLDQIATPAELYSSPATPFVGEFVGLSNRLPAEARDRSVHVLGADLPTLEGSTTGAGLALVRPESVSFTRAADGRATIASVAFLGPVSRATATLQDGTLVVAQLESARAAALAPGDRVRVEIAPVPVLVVGA